jgi:hypothetical protein
MSKYTILLGKDSFMQSKEGIFQRKNTELLGRSILKGVL